jgi:hypothetical protein
VPKPLWSRWIGFWRTTGDLLPGTGPFTVFRGVSGRGRARRIRGLPWTSSLSQAAWFAARGTGIDPAVYRTMLDRDAACSRSFTVAQGARRRNF